MNREVALLEKSGVVRRVADAKFASKVVLVEEGQQGQDFRMCVNFMDLNQMTVNQEYAMKDTWQLADLWGDATVGTILDMKACYHNIPVEEESQDLLGMVT